MTRPGKRMKQLYNIKLNRAITACQKHTRRKNGKELHDFSSKQEIKDNISQIKMKGSRILTKETSKNILLYYYNELQRERCKYVKGNAYLQPIEMVWSMLKRHIADKYHKQTNLSDLKTRIKNSFERISNSPMKVDNIVSHVIKLENQCYSQMNQEYPHLAVFGGENR